MMAMSTLDVLEELAQRQLASAQQAAASLTNTSGLVLGLGGTVASMTLAEAKSGAGRTVALIALAVMLSAWLVALLRDRRVEPDEPAVLQQNAVRGTWTEEDLRREITRSTLTAASYNRRLLERVRRLHLVTVLGFALIVVDAFVVLG